MKTPLVTIITPVYNHEKYIAQCIDSVISQTFTNWEQIIVDDGSTDNTKSIIVKYNDSRIKLISQVNKGISRLNEIYNTALYEAKGDFIAILEGDDYWEPNKLMKQLPFFEDMNIDLVWGAVSWVHEDGSHIINAPQDILKYKGMNNIQYLHELLLGNFIPAVTVMLRKDKLLSMQGFQQTPYMVTVDYATWIQFAINSGFAVVEDVVAYWRRHSTQMSTARQHEILDGTLKFSCEFYTKLTDEIKMRLNINKNSILSHWQESIAESCFYEGRKCLLRKHWKQAYKEFRNSIRNGGVAMKLKSIIGIVACYGHFNMELIAKLLGKESINPIDIWF